MENFNDYAKNAKNANNANNAGKGGGSGRAGGNGFGSTNGAGGSGYAGDSGSGVRQGNLFGMVNDIARKFEGKDQNELLKAIFDEAKKNKKNGTLTNAEIDNFAAMLAPVLDDKKRKILDKIVADLKKI